MKVLCSRSQSIKSLMGEVKEAKPESDGHGDCEQSLNKLKRKRNNCKQFVSSNLLRKQIKRANQRLKDSEK
jgi:hypothetical protein